MPASRRTPFPRPPPGTVCRRPRGWLAPPPGPAPATGPGPAVVTDPGRLTPRSPTAHLARHADTALLLTRDDTAQLRRVKESVPAF
ncbi:hypothetical protein DEF28_26040, partial [Marinitenerispora sediminis]